MVFAPPLTSVNKSLLSDGGFLADIASEVTKIVKSDLQDPFEDLNNKLKLLKSESVSWNFGIRS